MLNTVKSEHFMCPSRVLAHRDTRLPLPQVLVLICVCYVPLYFSFAFSLLLGL